MLSKKPNIAVFFGGADGSYDLSEESGYWACQFIPRSIYQITPVRILPNGQWQVPLGNLPAQGPIKKMISGIFSALPALSPVKGLERLLSRPVNAIMTLIRGRGGDDGSLHGLGNTLSIPIVGASLPVCQQTSNKAICHRQVQDIVNSPASLHFKKNELLDSITSRIRRTFVPPLFVKPVYQEASVGVEEITSLDELNAAVLQAQVAGDILVQMKAPGEEVSLTLFDDAKGKIHTLPPTVITPLKSTFYDQLAKRRPGRVSLNTSFNQLPATAFNQIREKAAAIYQELGCNGIISFDFMVNQTGGTFLEMNTVPSLTRLTPLFHQLKAQGMNPAQLLDQQIRSALENTK